MKRSGYIILVAVINLIMFSTHADSSEIMKDDKQGTISVTGTASDYYPPDMAEIVLAIDSSAKTVSEATQRNRSVSERVVEKLKMLIRDDKDDLIKTSSYSLQPEYEYEKRMKKNVLIGYKVVNQVSVKTGQIHEAGRIIDSAIDAGANRVISVNFTISDDRTYCRELLEKATKRGKLEAEIVAHSLGVQINGIKNVSASCGHTYEKPYYRVSAAQEKMMSATPIEPGAVHLSGTANIIFFIMDQ